MSAPVPSILRGAYPDIFFLIDRGECGLGYSPKTREFWLRVRARGPVQLIHYCPFTGARLPEPLRDRFVEELEAIGLMDGWADVERAPEEFQSEAWWIARGL